jgi:hypothetical protein
MEAQELNPIDWYLEPEEGDRSEDDSGTNDETDVEEEVVSVLSFRQCKSYFVCDL